tara:strand:- start:48954 stop:49064 length:111 start_codon:yes stop_codon:yes gene_type:complete
MAGDAKEIKIFLVYAVKILYIFSSRYILMSGEKYAN